MKRTLKVANAILLTVITIVSLSLSVAAIAQTGTSSDDNKPVKQDVKDAGHSTKEAAKKTGKDVKNGTKKAVNKSAQKTEQGAAKVEDKTAPKQ
jgi:hypothetical protein